MRKSVVTLLFLGTPSTCIRSCRAQVDISNASKISWKAFLEPKLWPFCRCCEVLGRIDTWRNLCGIFGILGHQPSINLPLPDEVFLERLNLVHLISLALVCVKLLGRDWLFLALCLWGKLLASSHSSSRGATALGLTLVLLPWPPLLGREKSWGLPPSPLPLSLHLFLQNLVVALCDWLPGAPLCRPSSRQSFGS
jgi:hypothetical protein